jgi:hypothetical protein
MKTLLTPNDKKMFYTYLDKASVYFEYGCGGSTYEANSRSNIIKIYSVESDRRWLNQVKKHTDSNKVVLFYNEMDTVPKTYGLPGKNSTPTQWINYSSHIRNLSEEEQQKIDLLLIDGRFRVACCLKCFDIIKADCFIAFDDFLNRKQYHVVLDYYNIIERTKDNRMVILQKKMDIQSIPEDIIKKYELISN